MADPIPIPGIPGSTTHRAGSVSSDGTGSSGPGSSGTESSGSPPLGVGGASYFGKPTSPSAPREKKTSVVSTQSPPSPATVKRLLRIRKMSEMSRSPTAGNITTIPTEVSDISLTWAKLVINQYRIKHMEPPLPMDVVVDRFLVTDCKKSSGDLSTTCRICVDVRAEDQDINYVFIAKLLPADDPCRVYVFESNVFEKEISIYFELLPCLRQFCEGTKLEKVMLNRIPQCIYGSNNCDGAGVLVFECAQEKGFVHPENPDGLTLDEVVSTVKFMAKFHAIGSAMLSSKGKMVTLRYPFLSNNVYSSPIMQEGARRMFNIYNEFLTTVSGDLKLQDKFTKYCNEECAAKEMFTCLTRQVDSPFNTIIHGELWEKNMLFGEVSNEGGEVEIQSILLDWKNAKIASATKDLAFFLLSSTSNSLRQNHIMDILQTYHTIFCDTLQTFGVNTAICGSYSFEDFYADYAMSTKGAFLQTVCVLVQEMKFMQYQMTEREEPHHFTHLTAYEKRALDVIQDEILNKTHFSE